MKFSRPRGIGSLTSKSRILWVDSFLILNNWICLVPHEFYVPYILFLCFVWSCIIVINKLISILISFNYPENEIQLSEEVHMPVFRGKNYTMLPIWRKTKIKRFVLWFVVFILSYFTFHKNLTLLFRFNLPCIKLYILIKLNRNNIQRTYFACIPVQTFRKSYALCEFYICMKLADSVHSGTQSSFNGLPSAYSLYVFRMHMGSNLCS